MESQLFAFAFDPQDPERCPDLTERGFADFESRDTCLVMLAFNSASEAVHAALCAEDHVSHDTGEQILLLRDDDDLTSKLKDIGEAGLAPTLFRLVEIGAEPEVLLRIAAVLA